VDCQYECEGDIYVGVKGTGFGDMEFMQLLAEDSGLWLKLKFL